MLTGILNTFLVFCSLILIFLVLIQRGKGGGLAGAFGGAGGSSAFGTKAGDVFTKVTMWVAGIWITLSMILVLIVNQGHTSAWGPEGPGTGTSQKAATTGSTKVKTGTDSATVPGGKVPDVEAVKPGEEPKTGTGTTTPSQPANPGDPLAPLPPAESKKTP